MRLLIFGVILITFTSGNVAEKGKWIIDSHSQLIINGNTNVNKFSCMIDCYNSSDTLQYYYDERLCKLAFYDSKMIVPIRNFDCGNKLMTKDFATTLKSDEFPTMEIKFLTLEKLATNGIVNGILEISLAGVSKKFEIPYRVETSDESKVHLSGKQNVCFSDFALVAPQKLMGLVQVHESLQVEFKIILRPI